MLGDHGIFLEGCCQGCGLSYTDRGLYKGWWRVAMVVLLEWIPVVWFLSLVGSLDGDCGLWRGRLHWNSGTIWWDPAFKRIQQ